MKSLTALSVPLLPNTRIRGGCLNMMLGPNQENGYRLWTEDRKTCLLEM
jgi:hypothetical protein